MKGNTMSDNAPEMKPIEQMTDREIAEETLYWLRFAGSALADIQRGGIGALIGQAMRGGKK